MTYTDNKQNNPFVLSGSSPPTVSQNDTTFNGTTEIQRQAKWLTVREAAEYLRCSPKTIYNLKCAGKISCSNRGGKKGALLFTIEDLDKFIKGERR